MSRPKKDPELMNRFELLNELEMVKEQDKTKELILQVKLLEHDLRNARAEIEKLRKSLHFIVHKGQSKRMFDRREQPQGRRKTQRRR